MGMKLLVAAPVTFPPSQKESVEGKTLLVVDDEHEVRELMSQVLCQQGYNVLQADGAVEALRLATAATIHLLLTDFSMPGIDGLELTRRFRAVYPSAPVLMVSGSLTDLDGRADDLDCFGILEKPFVIGELVRKVRVLLMEAYSVRLGKG
jgi:DNA-binding response OmpR family regulator